MLHKTATASRWSFILFAFFFILPAAAADIHDYPCEPDLIEIMFIQESQVRLDGGMPVDYSGLNATDGVDLILLSHGGGDWERITDIPELELDMWAETASINLGEPVYNLNNIYRIRLLSGPNVVAVALDLENLPGVHLAYPVALPPELPVPGDFSSSQNYLDPASSTPTGVDARYAWTQTGGDGTGVTICDLEYGWNYNHQDVSKAAGSQININTVNPEPNNHHGTGVIGEMVSDNNGWGTTGVAYGASLKTCGTYYGSPSPSWNIVGGMTVAIANLSAGDVMLLEQQWPWSGTAGFVPVEWYPHNAGQAQTLTGVYAAIQNAVGNGISVVEAGGNGYIDTDTMTWYGDSGAVIVGAGGAYAGGGWINGDLQKLAYSSYGSRFDVQAWGEDVVTTGGGDLHSAEGLNLYFTSSFSGTSSASPIVAGAIACMNGYYAANVSTTPMTPAVIRNTLKTTGTAQVTPPTGNIGPRPDLAAALATLVPPALWVDATTGPLADVGIGKSVAWGDVDNDGDEDIYITNAQSSNKLLRNDLGGVFTDITTPVLANNMFSGSAEFGDMDNDGLLDIYCGNWGNVNRLFHNQGLGGWMDVTMPPVDDIQDGAGVAWVDADNDGWLDIYVSTINMANNKFFLGAGAPNFVDASFPPLDSPMDSEDSAWSDYDNDRDMDCYIVYSTGVNELVDNLGSLMFNINPDPVVSDPVVGSGACWGDYDNDGDPDLYLTNQNTPNRLMRNDGFGFTDVTYGPLGDAGFNTGSAWADYDNDGDLDLYIANQTAANRLIRNDGGGIWTDDTSGPLGDTGPGRGTAWADYDNDGDLDIYLANAGGTNRMFRNDINNGNNWVQFKLTGTNCNASAVGARVKIVCAGQAQYREISSEAGYCGQNSLRVHFGLGAATIVDTLEIRWPGNGVETYLAVGINQVLNVVQSPWSGTEDGDAPTVCRLLPSAPNPFNPATTIRFELSRNGPVSLEIFDAAGRRIRTLLDEERQAGPHKVLWRGRDDSGRIIASGLYLVRLKAEGKTHTDKLVMMK